MIANHPLLPILKSILKKKKTKNTFPHGSMLDSESALPSDVQGSETGHSSEVNTFMSHTVSVASQISEDAHVGHAMQSIENECDFFTSEMSTFCQNLLKPTQHKEGPGQLNQYSNTSRAENKIPSAKSKLATTKKRVCLSKRNTEILREWLLVHADNPFPTDNEKDVLCLRTGLTLSKLNTWFVNSRRRILAPLGLRNCHKEMAELKN